MLMELTLHYAVKAAYLLFLSQLKSELRRSARPPLAVLTWRKVLCRLPLHDRALGPVAAGAFEIEFHTFASTKSADRSGVSGHALQNPPLCLFQWASNTPTRSNTDSS